MSSITALILSVNDSLVSGGARSFTFPVDSIYIIQSGSGSVIIYRGNRYFTTTGIASLIGTGLVMVTVLAVNGSLQTSPIKMSFPSAQASVVQSNLFGSNSAVTFFGNTYYVSETQAEILAASNAGSGGASSPSTLQDIFDNGGALDKNNNVDAGGHGIIFNNAGIFSVNGGDPNFVGIAAAFNVNDQHASLYTQADGSNYADFRTAADNIVGPTIRGEVSDGVNTRQLKITPTEASIIKDFGAKKDIVCVDPNLATNYTDDAAAAAGGIAVGEHYYSSGFVKVRLA